MSSCLEEGAFEDKAELRPSPWQQGVSLIGSVKSVAGGRVCSDVLLLFEYGWAPWPASPQDKLESDSMLRCSLRVDKVELGNGGRLMEEGWCSSLCCWKSLDFKPGWNSDNSVLLASSTGKSTLVSSVREDCNADESLTEHAVESPWSVGSVRAEVVKMEHNGEPELKLAADCARDGGSCSDKG